jgi:hypothetical protein
LQSDEVDLGSCSDLAIAYPMLLTEHANCMLLAGHLSPWLFKDIIQKEDVDIRPTIAITKAHMKVPELEESVKAGRLVPDGKICLNASGELAVTKFAVEPVWYLPGVAERFGIDEGTLRRSLFEHTGGSYPELITRGDIKTFLPPIGGLTVYCFGDPAKMSDPNVKLALRIHDECKSPARLYVHAGFI